MNIRSFGMRFVRKYGIFTRFAPCTELAHSQFVPLPITTGQTRSSKEQSKVWKIPFLLTNNLFFTVDMTCSTYRLLLMKDQE